MLRKTSHLAIQSFIKLTISWPRPPKTIFPGTGHLSRNLTSLYSILYQTAHILAQTIQDHISWNWLSFQTPDILLFNPSLKWPYPAPDPHHSRMHRSRYSSFYQVDYFVTQILQDHISWIWKLFQKPWISLSNPVLNGKLPKPKPSMAMFLGSG